MNLSDAGNSSDAGEVGADAEAESPERIGLFVDGGSLSGAACALGVEIDYRKLLDVFRARGRIVHAVCYMGRAETLRDASAIGKRARDFKEPARRRKTKCRTSVELAQDLRELAPQLDHAVLVSGSGDVGRLVERVQRRGVEVTVISAFRLLPQRIVDKLIRQADFFMELHDLAPSMSRIRDQAREIAPPSAARVSLLHGA
jgi:uncharacterized LabA/DUF88 family protein